MYRPDRFLFNSGSLASKWHQMPFLQAVSGFHMEILWAIAVGTAPPPVFAGGTIAVSVDEKVVGHDDKQNNEGAWTRLEAGIAGHHICGGRNGWLQRACGRTKCSRHINPAAGRLLDRSGRSVQELCVPR